MVSSKQFRRGTDAPVILSEGARVALGSVFRRVVKSNPNVIHLKGAAKRPRISTKPMILAEDEELHRELAKEKEEQRKIKEAKRAKQKFENNSLVIPDAATGAQLEKELLVTATKGAVALFNAVSKAQKSAQRAAKESSGKKGPAVSRESFMDMMRKGVNKEPVARSDVLEEDSASSDEDDHANETGAKWLNEDYLMAGSKKLKDWDRDTGNAQSGSSSEASDESDESEESESSSET